jgi:SSS family solute:Na+ symporter
MDTLRLGLPTLAMIVVYLAAINVLGAWIGRGQKDAKDYFLGSHAMPWWAVMGSIVATETSALTFLSVPGDAYRTGFLFLQLVFGYVVGRIAISILLLPGYFQREIATAYALLETRFGPRARRFTSLLFMVTRVLAAAVRLAVPAIPISLLIGIPVWTAVLLLAGATAIYTFLGGIKAVIWIDLIQVFIYLSGAILALGVLLTQAPHGLSGILEFARASGHPARLFDFSLDFSRPYTFWSGVIGGAFLTMATHGADQLIVQRLLACRTLSDARKAIVGSGFLVLVQMTLFVTIGVCLFAFFQARPIAPGVSGGFASPDDIFPTYIVKHLPPLISAYLVAGMFSAAMCSESSALNSLASALALDVVGPLSGGGRLEGRKGLALGRGLTLVWTVVLAALAVGFSRLGQTQPAVQVALGLASVTAGGLLGAFLLARYAKRAKETDVLWAIGVSAAVMMALWLGARGWLPFEIPGAKAIAWPWYSLIGSTIAVGLGTALSLRRRDGETGTLAGRPSGG